MHVIILGGETGGHICTDEIEILKLSQPFQWIKCNITLPEPMRNISTIISDDQLYIVGYYPPNTVSSNAYQVAVDSIISSIGQPLTSGHLEQTLDAPYLDTALLLHSYPSVIIGGDDDHGVPTSLMYIAILDIHEKGDMEQSSFFFYSKALCCSSANQ